LANQSAGGVVAELVRRLGKTQIILQRKNAQCKDVFAPYTERTVEWMRAYDRRLLPLTHRSHHSSEVGLPLLLVLILRVSDQIGVDGLALLVALQSVQLDRREAPISRQQQDGE